MVHWTNRFDSNSMRDFYLSSVAAGGRQVSMFRQLDLAHIDHCNEYTLRMDLKSVG